MVHFVDHAFHQRTAMPSTHHQSSAGIGDATGLERHHRHQQAGMAPSGWNG
jgi:hypothetical protein